MSELQEVRRIARKRSLCARSIEATVKSSKFERLWEDSDEREKSKAEHIIWKEDKKALVDWMRQHPSLDLGERGLPYLRDRGKKLRIKNYSRLSKPELIRAIMNKEKADEQEQSSTIG